MTNKVSIITVVYNSASTLEETILSVFNQTYENIEYIIIDGGSTDGSLDIIKKYEDKIAYWVSEPDNGIYDAMNKGTNKATGDWIFFIGSDDVMNDCLVDIVPFFMENTIVYGNVLFKYQKTIYDGKFNSFKLISKNIPHQAIFYPSVVLKNNMFNTKYKYFADYYLNLQLWKDKKLKFEYIPFVITIYNEKGASSQDFDKAFFNDQLKMFLQCMPWYVIPYVFIRKTISLIKNRK